MKTKRCITILVSLVMLFVMSTNVFAVTPPNLITNSDFEAGDTGFISDYTAQNDLTPPLTYAVGTSPSLHHIAWLNFGDHTSGNGKMMIVNGDENRTDAVVWRQDVTGLIPNPIAPKSFELYAGQHILVGEVLVKSDGAKICVKFVLSEDAIAKGWVITETHVAVADEATGIPQNNGNPIPGKFPEGGKFNPGVTESGWYCLPIEAGWTAPYAVAAHAKVEKIQTGYHVSDCLFSDAGSDMVTLLAEDASNPGYPVGYTADYQTSYPEGTPSVLAWAHNAWGPYGITGANWISSAYNSETPDDNTWRLFTRSLDIPVTAANVSATLTMNADNAETAYVNGVFVGDGSPAIVYGPSTKDVSPAIGGGRHGYDSVEGPIGVELNAGSNNLWIMTRNYAWSGGSEANPTALIYKLCYAYDMPAVVTQTESAWGGTNEFSGKNWAKYINFTPTTPTYPTYTISFWAKNSFAGNADWPISPAQLQVKINDSLVGGTLSVIAGDWIQFTTTWSAGAATSAKIEIRDINPAFGGNDFCIDDISFIKN